MCRDECQRPKISMVTFWSGRTSDVAQGGMNMRDPTTGLGDQPPAPPRTLEQIPLQELYRPVPEEVLSPVTPPPVPAEQPIEVDDEDMQPPDQPQQSMQPPLTPLGKTAGENPARAFLSTPPPMSGFRTSKQLHPRIQKYLDGGQPDANKNGFMRL